MIGVKPNLDSQLLDIQLNLEICIVSVHLTDGKQLILICVKSHHLVELDSVHSLPHCFFKGFSVLSHFYYCRLLATSLL